MKIGLALGSGSARGWSHIGVLRALREHGIEPTIVTGASTGSLVAASHASDQLDALEAWARTLTKIDVWRLMDAAFSGGGVMRGNRLMRAVGEQLVDQPIETLPRRFGAVAVDLYSGKEAWIQKGSMLGAVRASSGLPGLFTPILHDNRWLIDGGVLNPVPVSLCRALGADYVIAVNLNRPYAKRENRAVRPEVTADREDEANREEGTELFARWSGLLENFVNSIRSDREPSEPGMIEVLYTTINIMQDQISRSRMLGDPADLVVTPQVGHFHLMEFHRAAEAIEIGYAALEQVASELPDGS
ncbi:MAG: patatin-like phospholipase RssA [Gammaproteobacteria bacterium]|nr:patatin-like phospholipase RssA [Gammaproteobacteria bacterium]MBU2675962.1 patatin-like phospholipase RssA [Gammaproteobacteria bacterium]NNL49698.1 patatin-like phospholipase RssA [Woeseiaceae bacterium]